jgi:hypothetical protein
VQVARKFSEDRVALRAVIFDFDGGSCFDSQMERCGF